MRRDQAGEPWQLRGRLAALLRLDPPGLPLVPYRSHMWLTDVTC